MSLTFVITSNVQNRYRGFLGSTMLELASGVYISPRMNKGVRERVWSVLSDWHSELGEGSITLVWRDKSAPGGIRINQLGEPAKELTEVDDLLLVRREIKSGTLKKSAS